MKSDEFKDLKADLDRIKKLVEQSDSTPVDYIAAKDYLNRLDATVRALEEDAANGGEKNDPLAVEVEEAGIFDEAWRRGEGERP